MQNQEQAERVCHKRPQDIIELDAKRMKLSNNVGGSGPLLPVAKPSDSTRNSLPVKVNVASSLAPPQSLKSTGAKRVASGLARPVIWPPMNIVQNLHTGVVDGHWDGISHANLKKMLGNKWNYESLQVNPKGGGHRGEVLLFWTMTG